MVQLRNNDLPLSISLRILWLHQYKLYYATRCCVQQIYSRLCTSNRKDTAPVIIPLPFKYPPCVCKWVLVIHVIVVLSVCVCVCVFLSCTSVLNDNKSIFGVVAIRISTQNKNRDEHTSRNAQQQYHIIQHTTSYYTLARTTSIGLSFQFLFDLDNIYSHSLPLSTLLRIGPIICDLLFVEISYMSLC